MPNENLSKMGTAVMNFFTEAVKKINQEVRFVKRRSKLGGELFAKALIVGCLSDSKISLEGFCQLLKEAGVKITKQGLQERFNKEAVLLMKQLFEESLRQFKHEGKEVFELLNAFSGIKIQDSSVISLPDNLKTLFKGCGGRNAAASMKLQVLWDYVRGEIDQATLTEGCQGDQGFNSYSENIAEGSLYLQDLGYFKLDFFERVAKKGAYFVSRYLYPTTLLTEENQPLDILKELKRAGHFYTKQLWLGKNKSAKVRLTATRLSDEAIRKRIKKITLKARQRGRKSAPETLELAKWSIYITNVSEAMLTDEQVHLIYTLRWQIELFFKLCKSQAGIDKSHGKKAERILCEFYSKLICVVILLYFSFQQRWQIYQELSFYKAYKLFKTMALDFFKALRTRYRCIQFLGCFMSHLKDFSLKDRYRNKNRLTYQKIMDAVDQEVLV